MTSTPVAWMHILHMEDGQTAVRLARTEIDRPWGKPGIDFDRTYSVMIEPLYTHPSTDLLPVAYIQQEVLDVLAKDKTATGTVCSGLIQKPFGNPVPLYTHPVPSGQAVAVRHSFDGDGWLYADKGNGSDWLKRAMAYSDAEPLFTLSQPHTADERVVEVLRIAEERLSSLLARVHRDGGHYEAAHGTEKAWADADEIIARIYADDTHPAHSPAALASVKE